VVNTDAATKITLLHFPLTGSHSHNTMKGCWPPRSPLPTHVWYACR